MEAVKAPWDGVVLVCRKCSKKAHGGFGKKGKESLSEVLRATLKATGRRRAVRVVPVDCLGLCPKKAVAIVGSAAPGHVTVVPVGADAATVLAALG